MNTRKEQIEAIFGAAIELSSPEQRAVYLAKVCGDDNGLRREVEELIQAYHKAGGFLTAGSDHAEAIPRGEASGVTVLLPVTEKPGDRIGRYRLLEQIGEGGCGVVYMAEQEEPVRRRVALKVIKLGMDTKQVVARFEAERQALALMDHPNIAQVFDGGATDTGRPYFVLELVRGVRITDYCDQNHLATADRLRLFIQVCHAIQHAHQKGIIHRDIKPSNILVSLHDDVPVPKVIDFGIAKAMGERLTDKTFHTQFEQFMGTPAYMSPEQAGRSDLDIDTRSDIYALGVLLYELLTGSTPFDTQELLKAGLEEVLRTIREKEPVRPSTRLRQTALARAATAHSPLVTCHSSLATDLDWIVMKCLEKNRTRRYEAANALALDIERHLNNEPVAARPPSTAYRIEKFVRRNKVMVVAGSAVAAALVLGIVGSTWQAVRATRAEREQSRQRQRAEESEQKAVAAQAEEAKQRQAADEARRRAEVDRLLARQQAYAADMNLAQHALAMNDLGRAQRLLDGHRPQSGEPDLRGWEWRYLLQECQSDALGELCRLTNSAYKVEYAPDGKTLAVAGYPNQGEFVEIWDVPGRRRIATLQTNAGHLVAFSSRGDLLATAATQGGINIWQVGTTNLVRQITHPGMAKVLKFSPDGSRLVSLNHVGEVAVWEVNRWAIIRQVAGPLGLDEGDGALDFSPDGKTLVVGHGDGKLWVINLDTGRTRLNIPAHPEHITAVAWSPKGPFLASGSGYVGGPIRFWDVDSGKLIGTLEGNTSWICQLIFSADGRRLYSAGADQTIRIWDVQEKRCLAVLRGSSDEVYGLALSPDGTTLASGSKDGVIAFWSARPQSKEEQPRLLSMQGRAAFAPDSRVMAVPRDGIVQLYELPALRQIESLSPLGTNVVAVAYSPDGALIAGGSSNGWVRVWSCGECRLLQEWRGHQACAGGLRFLSDGRRLVSGSYLAGLGGELICWDARTWQPVSTLVTANAGILAVSPDSRFAMAGDDVGQLSWWDTASGKRLAATLSHRRRVTGGAFSPDGARAASVGEDGTVALWDTSSLKAITPPFKGHINAAFGVAFSPDDRRLATGGGGRDAVKLWDLSTHRELVVLPGQGFLFSFVAFSPDGNWLAACNSQGQLHLWHAPSWAEIEAAEKREAAVIGITRETGESVRRHGSRVNERNLPAGTTGP
jgi:WD40 repeat protein